MNFFKFFIHYSFVDSFGDLHYFEQADYQLVGLRLEI